MSGKEIRFLVYAVALCILYIVINYLHNRDNAGNKAGQNDQNYVVKMPAALKYVCLSMFILGMIIFIVVFICRLRGVPSATIGLIRFALIFACIGLVAMIWAQAWHVKVEGSQLQVHRLLHKVEVLQFSDIDRVELTKKFQIVLYKDSKKIVMVDLLADNYERLEKSLKQYGKLS